MGSSNKTGARNDDPPDEGSSAQHTKAPDPVLASDAQVRDLVHELARIQDRLTAENRATGARPSPGATRRRAELLRRERNVIRLLRASHYAADRRDHAATERSPDEVTGSSDPN